MSTSEKIEYIKQIVSRQTRVPVYMIEGPLRSEPYVLARHITAYLCREYSPATLMEIGHHLGRRHYTTVIHATRCMIDRIEVDERIRATVTALEHQLEDAGFKRVAHLSPYTNILHWMETKAA